MIQVDNSAYLFHDRYSFPRSIPWVLRRCEEAFRFQGYMRPTNNPQIPEQTKATGNWRFGNLISGRVDHHDGYKVQVDLLQHPSKGRTHQTHFAAAGVPYEDNRIEKSNWPQLKETFPYGKVPVLEVDGKPLAESGAICRFLARQFDLVGSSEFDAAKCDEYVDAMMDSRAHWKAYFFEADVEKKGALRKEFLEKQIPQYFPKFEKILNESEGNFLVGKNYTWADLHIAHTLAFYEDTVDPEILAPYPNLKKFKQAVFDIPQIKKWVEERPKTHM